MTSHQSSIMIAPQGMLGTTASYADVVPYALPNVQTLSGLSAVVREDYLEQMNLNQVAIVIGAGGGHEPYPFGFVGNGMATAAVCGNTFSAPSETAILRTLAEVTGSAGAFVIYLNFSGDKQSFESAIGEAKRKYSFRVESVCVSDDVSTLGGSPRGIAGAVLLVKLAGAASQSGASVSQISRLVLAASKSVYSVGVGLGPVSVPGTQPSKAAGSVHFQMGVGIHGESGSDEDVGKYLTSEGCVDPQRLVAPMITALLAAEGGNESDKLVVESSKNTQTEATGGTTPTSDLEGPRQCLLMVNNLGNMTVFEEHMIVHQAIDQLRQRAIHVVRVLSGRFVTCLKMPGVSITIMMLDENRLKMLDRPAGVVHFPPLQKLKGGEHLKPVVPRQMELLRTFSESSVQGPAADKARGVLEKVCRAIMDAEPKITELDTLCGDGDCGINFKRASSMVNTELGNGTVPLVSAKDDTIAPQLFMRVGEIFAEGAGGSTGALYSQLLQGVADNLRSTDVASLPALAAAINKSVHGVADAKQVGTGMRTMMDALIPAIDAFVAHIGEGKSFSEALAGSATAAEKGAEETKMMVCKMGRGTFIPFKNYQGHMDPGAYAVSVWVRALSDACSV